MNKVPHYIKKLYGEDAFISYNIDSIRRYGADWITLTETFKEVNIRNLKYSDPSKNGLPEVISMIISGFVGTILGKKILVKYGSKYFKLILNATLTIIAIYLLWNAIIISKIFNDLNLFA